MRPRIVHALAALFALTALVAVGAEDAAGQPAKKRTPQKPETAVEAVRLTSVSAIRPEEAISMASVTPVAAIASDTAVSSEPVTLPVLSEETSVKSEVSAATALSAESLIQANALSEVKSLVTESDVDLEKVIGAVAIAASVGVPPERLREVAALMPEKTRSRFDALNPGFASKLWVIKTRALEAEKQGKNTDELWEAYWKVFEKSVRTSRK